MANTLSESELNKRLKLQALFKSKISNLDIEKPDNYVSKLKPIIPIGPVKNKKILLTNTKIKETLGKECFQPIVKLDTENLEYSGSKYFGKVWLSHDESWPTNNTGQYLTFVLQLDVATLPEKYSKILGGTGIVQFFYNLATGYMGDDLIRLVYPNEHGNYTSQPLNERVLNNYYIANESNELPQQKIITSWKIKLDFPHYEEFFDEDKNNLFQEFKDSDKIEKMCTIQGDKLGGYAFWTQAGSSSEGLLFQLDAGSFYDGVHFEAHAPLLFAGDGTGHIFYEVKNKEFYFDWACG